MGCGHSQAFTNVQLKGKKSQGGHRRGIYIEIESGGSTHAPGAYV